MVKEGIISDGIMPEIHTYFKGGMQLWGDTPAIDVLNLKDNEGLNYDKDLNICFTS